MKVINKDKYRIESFDSFGEFIDRAKANKAPLSSNKEEKNNWSGTKSLAKACELAHVGWTKVRPQVDTILNDLESRIAMTIGDRFVTTFRVTGCTVDMGRFMSGEPECMQDFSLEPEAGMGKVVKVLVSGVTSANVSPDHIMSRGCAVLALVDTLHKLGVGIELWWESTIEGSDSKTHAVSVKLHDSSEMLDINGVMFALAHPSMLRRLQFSVQEQSETAKQQNVGGGYGYCTVPLAMTNEDSFDVVIEKLEYGTEKIVSNPMDWVVNTVRGLNLIEE